MKVVDGMIIPDSLLDPQVDLMYNNRLPVYKYRDGRFICEVPQK